MVLLIFLLPPISIYLVVRRVVVQARKILFLLWKILFLLLNWDVIVFISLPSSVVADVISLTCHRGVMRVGTAVAVGFLG